MSEKERAKRSWFDDNREKISMWLVVAQHEDRKRAWPWYGRFQHWLFVSWFCPCCKLAKKGVLR